MLLVIFLVLFSMWASQCTPAMLLPSMQSARPALTTCSLEPRGSLTISAVLSAQSSWKSLGGEQGQEAALHRRRRPLLGLEWSRIVQVLAPTPSRLLSLVGVPLTVSPELSSLGVCSWDIEEPSVRL